MFERVSRQVESSPCCDWGTPSSAYAPHARTGTMFGPVEFGDSSTHRGALRCGASRFGLVKDGACAFADGWTARSSASRERHRFRAVPPRRMPRPRPNGQGASAAVSREAGGSRFGDGATALRSGVGRGDAVRQNSRSVSRTRHRGQPSRSSRAILRTRSRSYPATSRRRSGPASQITGRSVAAATLAARSTNSVIEIMPTSDACTPHSIGSRARTGEMILLCQPLQVLIEIHPSMEDFDDFERVRLLAQDQEM